MHIPDQMLTGSICPVTAVVGAIGVATATYFTVKEKNKPSSLKFAAVTALIFAAQMMNFPVLNGTSGHLLGTTLAVMLLGIPFGILSIVFVVVTQSLVFADGGVSVLGANIINMALVGAIPGIFYTIILKKYKEKISCVLKNIFLFLGSLISVILASASCSLMLGLSGTVGLLKVLPAMVGIHILIGIGEGVITLLVSFFLTNRIVEKTGNKSFLFPTLSAFIVALILSPFASGFPDGLEWVAERFNFLHENAPYFVSPFPDYSIPVISNEIISTGLSGLFGVAIIFAVTLLFGVILRLKLNKV